MLTLRPAYMKLDRGWVQGIESDPVRQALVAGLQHFAQRTGCRLIAGESRRRGRPTCCAASLGVEYGQGFLLGMPQPAPGERLAEPAAR